MRLLPVLLLLCLAACQPAPPARYVNLYDECFDRQSYGRLLADTTPLYLDHDGTRSLRSLAHGSRVEVLEIDEAMAVVRAGDLQGYLPLGVISDYDPAAGVKPDPSACAA